MQEYFEKFRRNVYVPKSYLSFIDGYRSLYQKKLDDVNVLADKINSGLSKLFEAKSDVKKMQVELTQKNKDLAEHRNLRRNHSRRSPRPPPWPRKRLK